MVKFQCRMRSCLTCKTISVRMARQPKLASETFTEAESSMRDASPEFAPKSGTLSRRTLLAATSAALLGTMLPVRGVGAIGGQWALEVDAPQPGIAAQTGEPLPS